jgi:hypothetical protein
MKRIFPATTNEKKEKKLRNFQEKGKKDPSIYHPNSCFGSMNFYANATNKAGAK